VKQVRITRRDFFTQAGAAAAAGLGVLRSAPGQGTGAANSNLPTVKGLLRLSDSLWCFDPLGLYVAPGETVRFVNASIQMITITSYHPQNDNHELRMPEQSQPFDFGMPERPYYDVKFEVEGTYDFFSRHQELLGMIGRLVVGRPAGPAEKPWGYGAREGRNPIYEGVLRTARLLNSQEIVDKKVIRFPFDEMSPPYPMW
jgi:plastocyanin